MSETDLPGACPQNLPREKRAENVLPRLALLPDSAKRPLLLVWVATVPQLILLLVNLRAYWIISGECTLWQRKMSALIGAFQLVLMLGPALLALGLRARRRVIPEPACVAMVILSILYLWMASWLICGQLIPASVSWWMLRPEQLLYFQFIFTMPSIAYALIRLACMKIRVFGKVETMILLAILVVIPGAWILVAMGNFAILHWIPEWLFMPLLVLSTVVIFLGLTRVCVRGYRAVWNRGPKAVRWLSVIVGIVGPIAGLLLNAKIPFPADFQTWPVYAMALVNGAVLLLPDFEDVRRRRWVWLAQCTLFPFTLYFFLVFLPFLPLWIPALIAAGSGFLIVTPTVLFLVHGQCLLDGFRRLREAGMGRRAGWYAAAAMMILPGIIVSQATIDRFVLRGAIDYVYSPNYRTMARFGGSRFAVRRSLERLRDFKAGVYAPFLSEFYSWAVFDNLVLPDEKMDTIHQAFFGSKLEPVSSNRIGAFGGSTQRGRTVRERSGNPTPPPSNVGIAALTASTKHEGGCERTTLALDMKNNSGIQSEFATVIRIPEGVLVSGFWLRIGDERVAGRLFEKKTALWVYQQIRDSSRRDPGILVYNDPHSIELRVFPFSACEQRHAEVEFIYPATLHPDIAIGDRHWKAEGTAGPENCVAVAKCGNGTAVLLNSEAMTRLPRAPRTAYPYFIIDRSAASKMSDGQIVRAMRSAAGQFAAAAEFSAAVANYEYADLCENLPVKSLSIEALHIGDALPQRGGFLAERAMKRALLRYHEKLVNSASDNGEALRRYPVLIVISDTIDVVQTGNDLPWFGAMAPDARGYFVSRDGEHLTGYTFQGKRLNCAPRDFVPISLLKVGDSVAPCPLEPRQSQVVRFDSGAGPGTLSVLDGGAFRSFETTAAIPETAPYAKGVQAQQFYLEWIYNPSLGNRGLEEVVKLSRESGFLLAATSYIVVENSAQWKMLQLKQNQKLRNAAALEFEEVPEPATGFLVMLGGMALGLRRRRRVQAPPPAKTYLFSAQRDPH